MKQKIRLSHLCNKKCPKMSKKCATCMSTSCTFQDFGNEHIFDRGHFNSKNNKNLKKIFKKWTKGCPFNLAVSNHFDPPVSMDQ